MATGALTFNAVAEERRSMNANGDDLVLLDAWEVDTPAGRIAVVVVDHRLADGDGAQWLISTRVIVRGEQVRASAIVGSRWEDRANA